MVAIGLTVKSLFVTTGQEFMIVTDETAAKKGIWDLETMGIEMVVREIFLGEIMVTNTGTITGTVTVIRSPVIKHHITVTVMDNSAEGMNGPVTGETDIIAIIRRVAIHILKGTVTGLITGSLIIASRTMGLVMVIQPRTIVEGITSHTGVNIRIREIDTDTTTETMSDIQGTITLVRDIVSMRVDTMMTVILTCIERNMNKKSDLIRTVKIT